MTLRGWVWAGAVCVSGALVTAAWLFATNPVPSDAAAGKSGAGTETEDGFNPLKPGGIIGFAETEFEAPRIVRLFVFDLATGQPIPGARVVVSPRGEPLRSDRSGIVAVCVRGGASYLGVRAPRYSPREVRIDDETELRVGMAMAPLR